MEQRVPCHLHISPSLTNCPCHDAAAERKPTVDLEELRLCGMRGIPHGFTDFVDMVWQTRTAGHLRFGDQDQDPHTASIVICVCLLGTILLGVGGREEGGEKRRGRRGGNIPCNSLAVAMNVPCATSHSNASKLDAVFVDQCIVHSLLA